MPSGGHTHVGLQGPRAPPGPGLGAHRGHPAALGSFAWMWICLMRPAEKSSVSRRPAGRK